MIALKQVLKAGCECWMGQAKTKYFEINVLTLSSWCLTTERDSCWPNRARKASASDSLNLLESNLLFMGYLKDLRTNLYEAIIIDKWQLFLWNDCEIFRFESLYFYLRALSSTCCLTLPFDL